MGREFYAKAVIVNHLLYSYYTTLSTVVLFFLVNLQATNDKVKPEQVYSIQFVIIDEFCAHVV